MHGLSDFLGAALEQDVPVSRIRPADDGAPDDAIADSTSKFIVPGPGGDEAFLILSGSGNPDLVARAAEGIRIARATLPDPTRQAVLPPLFEGRVAGLSCAAWPRHRPFGTDRRLRWYLRRWRHAPPLLDWACKLCTESLSMTGPRAETDETYRRAISSVMADEGFPAAMRSDAETALARLDRGTWRPLHCLQHGDLWAGNILLPAGTGTSARFFVIDWAGLKRQGFPVFDLVRLADSLRCSGRMRDRMLDRIAAPLGCERFDLRGYLIAAIGNMGEALEFFPREAYYGMAARSHAYLEH